MTDHTPERLRHSGSGVILGPEPTSIRITKILDDAYAIADREFLAERMVAAYNACAGIPTEQLQPGMMGDMKTTLRDAAKWFREYERRHATKGTEAGDDKAKRNGDRAEHCEAALAPFQ